MNDRLIIALDVESYEAAARLVDQLPDALFFKVGLQAYMGYGERILSLLHARGKNIFLDLKFNDIPNTVSGAVQAALRFSPRFLTLHLSGGRDMICRAREAVEQRSDVILLGVTVLTSLNEGDLHETGICQTVSETVLRLVELGVGAGLKGFVSSPQDVGLLRKKFGSAITLVTPGIRPVWFEPGDQKRICTPAQAVAAGSDYLVIGRPITHHPEPAEAFRRVAQECAD